MFNIYDKNETNFLGLGLAVLTDVRNAKIKRRINSTYELTFEYPLLPGDTKAQYLEKENIIKADGQLFRIIETEKYDTGDRQWIKVRAPHIFFDLIDYDTEDKRVVDASVQTALERLLEGTPFTVGICDDLGLATAYFIEENKLKSINDKIIPRWKCEIEIDNFTVTAKARIGQDKKIHIRRGKNLKGLNYKEDISGVITRLYVKGKNGLTIESVNNGKKYIDSPYIGNYSHIKVGRVTFEDIEDPQELLEAAQEYLQTVDKPYVYYAIDLIELRDSEEYKYFKELETLGLGDTVYIWNDRLGIEIEARILEYEYDPVKRQNSIVVLGNFTNRIEDVLGQFEDTKRRVDRAITDEGYVRTSWLQGEIDLLVNRLRASGAYQHVTPIEGKGALFENTDPTSPDFGALYIGPGIFAIANSKNPDGSWNWRVFGTGKGFSGDEIMAGRVRAQFLQIGSQTEFEAGYDPSQKETPEGAQAKVDAAKQDVITYVNTELQVRDGRIEAKADKTTVDELGNRISEAEAQLAVQANEIAARVTTTQHEQDMAEINSNISDLDDRLTQAEAELVVHANEIATKVSQTTFTQELAKKENAIVRSSTAPANPTTGQLWIDTSVMPNALKRWDGTAWVKVTPTTAGEVGAYTKTETDTKLATKADTDDLTALEGRVSTAESTLIQHANMIATKVSQSDFDLLEDRVSSAESTISQHADEIATKVSQTVFNQELAKKENAIVRSNTAPSNPAIGQLWIDTSVIPNVLKRWDGSAWVKATPTTAGEVGAYTKTETDNKLASKADADDLTALEGRVYTAESTLVQHANQIATKVSQTDFDLLEDRVTNAESTLTQHANEIALRVTQTTFNSAMNSINSELDSLDNRLSQAELKIIPDAIVSTVRQSSAYQNDLATAENNAKVYADDKVSNIKIGGRNILINSDFSKQNTNGSSTKHPNLYADYFGGYNSGITNPTNSYHAHLDTDTFSEPVYEFNESDGTRNWKGISQNVTARIKETGQYTISVDLYATDVGTKFFGGFYYYRVGDTSPGFRAGQFNIVPIETNKWVRMSAQCNLGDDVDFSKPIVFYMYGYGFSSNAILYMKRPKLEKGNKATDWTPAPEDVDSTIDGLDTRLTQAESTIVQHANEIATKVSQTDFDLLEGRVTSAESTLTQHANEIALRVRKDQLGSEIVQNAASVKIAVGQIGGNNLLKNSSFEFGSTNWNGMVTGTSIVSEGIDGGKCLKIVSSSFGNAIVIYQDIPASVLKKGKKYTLSAEVKGLNIVKGTTNPFVALYGEYYNNSTYVTGIGVSGNFATGTFDWTKYSITFTVRNATDYTRLCVQIYMRDWTGTLWVDNIKLEEGENATAWSPNPNELKSSTMEVTDDHVNIRTQQFNLELLASNGEDNSVIITAENQGFNKLYIGELTCPNAVLKQAPTVINVGDNQIQATINSLNKYLAGDVRLVLTGTVYNETVVIDGFYGNGGFILDLNGKTINGRIQVLRCGVYIGIYNGTINIVASGISSGIAAYETMFLSVWKVKVNCYNNSQFGIQVHCTAKVNDCEVYDATEAAFTVSEGHTLFVVNCRGIAKYGLQAGGAFILKTISVPGGTTANEITWDGGQIFGSAPVNLGSAAPPKPTILTKTYLAVSTASWRSSGWRTDNDRVYQGNWGYGNHKGLIFFGDSVISDIKSAFNGYNITSVKLYIKRAPSHGVYSAQNIRFYSHNYASKPGGEPALGTDYGNLIALACDQESIVNIPTSFITEIRNNQAKGLAIYQSGGSPYVILLGKSEYDIRLEITGQK